MGNEKVYILLMTAFIVYNMVSAKVCPNAWTRHQKSCYHFSREKLSMAQAAFICEKLGGSLAEINSWTELKWLRSKVVVLGGEFWIGATDRVQEGHFVWLPSGKQVLITYWHPNEPNNYRGIEQCVIMAGSDGGKWYDDYCDKSFYYICEQ